MGSIENINSNCFSNFYTGCLVNVLSHTDAKVYNFVVSKIIPVISVAALIGCSMATFVVSPWFVVGIIPFSLLLGYIGTLELKDRYNRKEKFIENQPIGINNPMNQCWANSSIQLIMNNPSLRQRCSQVPTIKTILDQYRADQNQRLFLSENLVGFEFQQQLARMTNGNEISYNLIQEDPSTGFEILLGSTTGPAHYSLVQKINGRNSSSFSEPYLSIDVASKIKFSKSLDKYFENKNDLNKKIKVKISGDPADLLLKLNRFRYVKKGNEYIPSKINRPIDVPCILSLSSDKFSDGIARKYSCSGFIVHQGSRIGGGHYVSYVKNRGKWWYCDDRYVRQVGLKEVNEAKKHSYFVSYSKAI